MNILTVAIFLLGGFAIILVMALIRTSTSNDKKRKRGLEGERVVSSQLKMLFGRKKNYIFNDLTIPTVHGATQIDHLVICKQGIICIETKYLNGSIYGDLDSQNWTHYNGLGDKNRMYNPIKQNKGHIKHLARTLAVSEESIKGFVVNVGNAKLKGNINPYFGKPLLETGVGFLLWFRLFSKKVLNENQVSELGEIIKAVALDNDRAMQQAHIHRLKTHNNNRRWF